ncbi:MAG TPA: copper resistance protein B [Thermomonas sp.]|nr:copper resistance protein B [Thermomonas sp.]
MNTLRHRARNVLALALLLPATGFAQHAGHAAAPAQQQPPQEAPATEIDHSKMDHSKMDHSKAESATAEPAAMDHSKMDHSTMDHSTMDHSKMDPALPREPIPQVTDADRAAAFPEVHAHHQHGTALHSYWLLDRLEVADGDDGNELAWEGTAWIGGDVRKLWLRSEGHAADGEVESGRIEVLVGQGVRAWWDVVAGVRHDIGEGPSRTWAALGVQGLAPYKFEVSATAYLGQGGRTAAVLEAEYDTLLSNRLILQWRAEAQLHGKDDPALGIGAGLGTVEAGLRLRYEVTRQFAPYIGLEHGRAFGNTADLRRAAGHDAGETQIVAGVRVWF